jgi:hypothetical protein
MRAGQIAVCKCGDVFRVTDISPSIVWGVYVGREYTGHPVSYVKLAPWGVAAEFSRKERKKR